MFASTFNYCHRRSLLLAVQRFSICTLTCNVRPALVGLDWNQQRRLLLQPPRPKPVLFRLPSHHRSLSGGSAITEKKKANKGKKKKGPKPRKLSKVEKKRRQREKDQRRNFYMKAQAKMRRMRNLHPAAKMKRVLSACDYWFSDGNLKEDYFLIEQLRDYSGYVPVSTLASFPKFEHWADLELIAATLRTEAATGRYRVIVNKDVFEKVMRNRKRQRIRQKLAEQLKRKLQEEMAAKERKERNKRIKELEAYIDEVRTEYFKSQWTRIQKEWAEEEEALEKEEEEAKRLKQSESPMTERSLIESATSTMNATAECVTNNNNTGMASAEKEKQDDCDDDEEDEMDNLDWDVYWDLDLEDDLLCDNEEFSEATDELEQLECEAENEKYRHREHRRHSEFVERFERDERNNEDDDIVIDSNDLEDEELPSPIVDDGSCLLQYALVKHKRVTLQYLDDLTRVEMNSYVDEFGEEIFYGSDDESDDDYLHDNVANAQEVAKPPVNKKLQNFKKYVTDRKIQVIKKASQLESFCGNLRESLQRSTTKAVGFDLEYCSLEMDIRTTLPAMLQIASPEPNGPVGLIWLHKFPDHGRNMIGQTDCEALLSILQAPTILKVGVGVSADAKHLASWWGINDKEFVSHFFSGMFDLESQLYDDRLHSKTLQEMCRIVLHRKLPKIKERDSEGKKQKRKKGKRMKTSHWRRDDLTPEMKEYAVNDASSAIDIWLEVKKTPDDENQDDDNIAAAVKT